MVQLNSMTKIYVIEGTKEVMWKNSKMNSVDYKGESKINVIF